MKMRSETEMFHLILSVAEKDERIRAVYLEGSRTNSNVPKDIFQDYDFVYLVTETVSFITNFSWIDVFGERLYMQLPEELDKISGQPYDFDNRYGYLIQLADGNRIDFHLQTYDLCLKEIAREGLIEILLDKDNLLPSIPPSNDHFYWVKKPTQNLYHRCCNEFWWVMNNVAKGLWREEITYVMDMINFYLRVELEEMITWYAGTLTGFRRSMGKCNKYLNKYLPTEMWDAFLLTYPRGDVSEIWDSVFVMCGLFEKSASLVGRYFGFKEDTKEAANSLRFLNSVKRLPKDAKEITLAD